MEEAKMQHVGVKAQLNVEMTCQSCVDSVTAALNAMPGVTVLDVDLERGEVELITKTVPVEKLLQTLRGTGRSASLQGLGGEGEQFGSAVSQLEPADGRKDGPHATLRFAQISRDRCLIEALVEGFPPGQHSLAVHEYGDLSDSDRTVGHVWDPLGRRGVPKPAGFIGHVEVDQSGEGMVMTESGDIKVWDIIGRSVVARPVQPEDAEGISFGVIARSAGVRENPKKICLCDNPNF